MTSSQEAPNLSTQPYRGTRDFYPELQARRTALFAGWKRVLERFGYEEYDAPLIEPLELYAAKSSEEIVSQQLYAFTDRGGRRVALRPEMTPSLARMVAARVKQLPRPVRWFSIPRCLRYERPQRGRLREFDQLNVDVFGGKPMDEDLEILSICAELLLELGAKSQDFEILVNDRRLMNLLLGPVLGLPTTTTPDLLRLIDRRDKVPSEVFQEKWEALTSAATGPRDAVLALLELPPETKPSEVLHQLAELLQSTEQNDGILLLRDLETLFSVLPHIYPDLPLRLDLGIARGFDYYTGLVFEIFDTHPENRRALFGGGRYDNLVGAFTQDALPGIGFGVSDVSLLNFCDVHQLPLTAPSRPDVAVIRFQESDRLQSARLAAQLRAGGLKVTLPLSGQKFGKQIQTAEKAGAQCVCFRGEDELSAESFSVKWLADGHQESFPCTHEGTKRLAEAISTRSAHPKN